MFGLSMGELIVLGLIIMVLFGTKRIPALGSSLAQGIRNFQKGMNGEIDDSTVAQQKSNAQVKKDHEV